MKKFILKGFIPMILFALGVMGCQAKVVTITPGAPEVWKVQVSPGLRVLGPVFNQCLQPLAGKALLYNEQAPASLDPSKADFTISFEPAPGADYTAILGHSPLEVVVNPANPFSNLSLASIEGIFSGKILTWADLAKTDCPACSLGPLKAVQPYIYAEGDDVGQVIHSLIPGTSSRLVNGLLAPNPGAVREAVAADPQAIGIIPALWLDGSVKSLAISGASAGSIQFPLVLSAAAEPSGARLSWLLCLQEKLR